MDGKIYRINKEVEVEGGNKKHWGGTDNKNGGGGKIIKLWRRKKEKIEEGNKIEKGEG